MYVHGTKNGFGNRTAGLLICVAMIHTVGRIIYTKIDSSVEFRQTKDNLSLRLVFIATVSKWS